MQSLNHDVQIQIFMYLYPEEIKSCYDCFSSILDELSSHIGFQIHCSTIVCNQTVSWFLKKKISLNLLHTKRTNNICVTTLRNYKCHSSNDIPSILYVSKSPSFNFDKCSNLYLSVSQINSSIVPSQNTTF